MSDTTQFVLEQVSAFEGSYPEIANRPDFQIDEGDHSPCYATLPLGQVGNTSANDRLYDRSFYQELVDLVNNGNPPVRGIVGHPDPKNASHETKLPNLEWVGATLTDDGTVWGKFYVYAEETKVRADVKRAAKRNYKVATSLRGNAVMEGNRATKPSDLWIDYVDPNRAGVKAAIATPILTQEMISTGDNPMADQNQDVISELRNDRNQAIQELAEVRAQLKAATEQLTVITELSTLLDTQDVFKVVSEMKKQMDEWQPLVTGVKALGEKPLQVIQEMQATIAELRQTSLVHTIVDAINEKVKFEGARPMIAELMGIERNEDGVTLNRTFADAKTALAYLDTVLERDSVKEMQQSMVFKASGGKATVLKDYGADWRESFIEQGQAKASAIIGGK